MLAYRHAFHAGNHADVLKHLVLMQVLRAHEPQGQGLALRRHPCRRRRLFAGGRATRNKRGEFEQGIARLWGRADLPPPLADYVALVRRFNGGTAARAVPRLAGRSPMR